MSDRFPSRRGQVSVTCAQLPGREMELAHREMMYASGGLVFPGNDRLGRYVDFAIRLVAEVIQHLARPR